MAQVEKTRAQIRVFLTDGEVTRTDFHLDGVPSHAGAKGTQADMGLPEFVVAEGVLGLVALLAETAAYGLEGWRGTVPAKGRRGSLAWALQLAAAQGREWVSTIFGEVDRFRDVIRTTRQGKGGEEHARAWVNTGILGAHCIQFFADGDLIAESKALHELARRLERLAFAKDGAAFESGFAPVDGKRLALAEHGVTAVPPVTAPQRTDDSKGVQLYVNGFDGLDALQDILRMVPEPKKAVLVQHSGLSVKAIIQRLLRRGASIDLYVQVPVNEVVVPNPQLRDRVLREVDNYRTVQMDIQAGRTLRVIGYKVPASLRCVLVEDAALLVGHYIHHVGMLCGGSNGAAARNRGHQRQHAKTAKARPNSNGEALGDSSPEFHPIGTEGPCIVVPSWASAFAGMQEFIRSTVVRIAGDQASTILELQRGGVVQDQIEAVFGNPQ